MRWFRSRTRCLVALLALVTQLVLSFGHVHLERSAAASIATGQPSGAPISGGQQPSHPSDDTCPICIAAGLLAVAQLPPPPLVPQPPSFVSDTPVVVALKLDAAAPALAFRSRAPPIV